MFFCSKNSLPSWETFLLGEDICKMLVIKKRWEDKAKKRKFFSWKRKEKSWKKCFPSRIFIFIFMGCNFFFLSFSYFKTFGQIREKVFFLFFQQKKKFFRFLNFLFSLREVQQKKEEGAFAFVYCSKKVK